MGVWDSSDMITQSFAKKSLVGEETKGYGARKMEMAASSWIRGSLIGAGAFGKVNLALNKENGELFAVKSIECNERTTSEMQAMKNEVEILSSLDSPYVVKCLGSSYSLENGKTMHNVFIEYMSGGSLADLMKKFGGHFDEPLIRNYTRSILEGILYLHKQEIVHCDIKGKNILVGSSGVKLADFGAAKRVGQSSVVDSMQSVKGTPLWMAPEVVRVAEQGPASDIWSLGCTVVEMATGKAPWIHVANAANPFVALYHIHCTEEVPELPSCLSEQGQDFLRKCFQRDPEMRWTAEQLLRHPFISESFPVQESKPVASQTSPSSTLDFPSHHDVTADTSSIVNSVPILRFPLFSKKAPEAFKAQADVNFQAEDAKQTSSSSSSADWWCNSPLSPMPGQWIVVRSPKATSPISCESTPLVSEAGGSVKESHLPVVEEESTVVPELASSLIAEGDSMVVTSAEYDQHATATDAEVSQSFSARASSFSEIEYETTKMDVDVKHQVVMASTFVQSSNSMGERCESGRAGVRSATRMSQTIRQFVNKMRRSISVVWPKSMNFASPRLGLRKLSTAHRKMTSRGRRRGKSPLRFTMRKEAHELLFEKLRTLGRSLHTCAYRVGTPRGVASYLETLGSMRPQFFRNRLFLNKTATSWWLLYKLSVSVNVYLSKFLTLILCALLHEFS